MKNNVRVGMHSIMFFFCISMSVRAQDTTYVDLGLSVKWATCNLGANSPDEYGDYYAWGETETKEKYDWSTYKWCEGDYGTITKYGSNKSVCLNIDNKTILELEDDAAHVKLGGNWRMPTYEEMLELQKNCTCELTDIDGIYGRKFTSKINGNSIFLPSAGFRKFEDLINMNISCFYWSSSLSDYNDEARAFCYERFYKYDEWEWRYDGLPIRPVTK